MKTLGRIFQYLWFALDGLRKVLHLIVLLVTFGIVFAALSPSIPIVPSKAVLVLDPQGVVVEQISGGPFERALAEAAGQERPETQLRDVVEAIDLAKDDSRIQALLIDPVNMMGAGLAKLDEIALAIQRFRGSGKPVIAFGESYDQAQYYLAAQADEIYLDPKGLVFIDGFGYYRMFFKDGIEKLGVDVNVFRAGKFKSFTDQFSRNDMSEQEREESQAWLNVLWTSYQSTVTKARSLDANAVSNYVEHIVPAVRKSQGDLASIAVEQRLVTELKTRHQVGQRLIALTGEDDEHSFHGVGFHEYLQAEQARRQLGRAESKIGVVIAAGEILDGSQPPGAIGGDSTAQLLKQARFDDDIEAVVLRIDSPGGSVFASEVIRREIELLKAAGKPVIASMSSTAASGGYYIAMNADEIFAARTTLTGSIGVFAVLPTFERTLSKWLGVHTDGIGTTHLSGGFALERSLTPPQRELLQLSVDHEYRQFIQLVANARGKTPDAIDAIAQGRVWAGVDAQTHGLIDKVGSFQDAVDAAAVRAELGKDYSLEYVETDPTWRQMFAYQIRMRAARAADAIAPERATVSRLLAKLSPLEIELKRLARFTDPLRAYYYCVCTVE